MPETASLAVYNANRFRILRGISSCSTCLTSLSLSQNGLSRSRTLRLKKLDLNECNRLLYQMSSVAPRRMIRFEEYLPILEGYSRL